MLNTSVQVQKSCYVQTCLFKTVTSKFLQEQQNSLEYQDMGLSVTFPNQQSHVKNERKVSNLLLVRLALLSLEIWCLVKQFPWFILFQELCVTHHAVIFEAVASLIIIHPPPICPFFTCSTWTVRRTICYLLNVPPLTTTHPCLIFLQVIQNEKVTILWIFSG